MEAARTVTERKDTAGSETDRHVTRQGQEDVNMRILPFNELCLDKRSAFTSG